MNFCYFGTLLLLFHSIGIPFCYAEICSVISFDLDWSNMENWLTSLGTTQTDLADTDSSCAALQLEGIYTATATATNPLTGEDYTYTQNITVPVPVDAILPDTLCDWFAGGTGGECQYATMWFEYNSADACDDVDSAAATMKLGLRMYVGCCDSDVCNDGFDFDICTEETEITGFLSSLVDCYYLIQGGWKDYLLCDEDGIEIVTKLATCYLDGGWQGFVSEDCMYMLTCPSGLLDLLQEFADCACLAANLVGADDYWISYIFESLWSTVCGNVEVGCLSDGSADVNVSYSYSTYRFDIGTCPADILTDDLQSTLISYVSSTIGVDPDLFSVDCKTNDTFFNIDVKAANTDDSQMIDDAFLASLSDFTLYIANATNHSHLQFAGLENREEQETYEYTGGSGSGSGGGGGSDSLSSGAIGAIVGSILGVLVLIIVVVILVRFQPWKNCDNNVSCCACCADNFALGRSNDDCCGDCCGGCCRVYPCLIANGFIAILAAIIAMSVNDLGSWQWRTKMTSECWREATCSMSGVDGQLSSCDDYSFTYEEACDAGIDGACNAADAASNWTGLIVMTFLFAMAVTGISISFVVAKWKDITFKPACFETYHRFIIITLYCLILLFTWCLIPAWDPVDKLCAGADVYVDESATDEYYEFIGSSAPAGISIISVVALIGILLPALGWNGCCSAFRDCGSNSNVAKPQPNAATDPRHVTSVSSANTTEGGLPPASNGGPPPNPMQVQMQQQQTWNAPPQPMSTGGPPPPPMSTQGGGPPPRPPPPKRTNEATNY